MFWGFRVVYVFGLLVVAGAFTLYFSVRMPWAYRRILAEPLTMLVVAVGGFVFAWNCVLPHHDREPLPPGVSVESPASLVESRNGTESPNLMSGAIWIESHDKEDEVDFYPATLGYVPPPFPNDGLRVLLSVSYERSVTEDVPIQLAVTLPTGAVDPKCSGPPQQKIECIPDKQRSAVDPNVAFVSRLIPGWKPSDRYLLVSGVVSRGSNYFTCFIDVRGTNGIVAAQTGSRARVVFPTFIYLGSLAQPVIVTGAGLPHGDDFTWSPRSLMPDMNVWLYNPADVSANASAAPITGVNEHADRRNDDLTFWAGIIFGVAGAAFIGFLQSVFSHFRPAAK